jgi:hypothetical protein
METVSAARRRRSDRAPGRLRPCFVVPGKIRVEAAEEEQAGGGCEESREGAPAGKIGESPHGENMRGTMNKGALDCSSFRGDYSAGWIRGGAARLAFGRRNQKVQVASVPSRVSASPARVSTSRHARPPTLPEWTG